MDRKVYYLSDLIFETSGKIIIQWLNKKRKAIEKIDMVDIKHRKKSTEADVSKKNKCLKTFTHSLTFILNFGKKKLKKLKEVFGFSNYFFKRHQSNSRLHAEELEKFEMEKRELKNFNKVLITIDSNKKIGSKSTS